MQQKIREESLVCFYNSWPTWRWIKITKKHKKAFKNRRKDWMEDEMSSAFSSTKWAGNFYYHCGGIKAFTVPLSPNAAVVHFSSTFCCESSERLEKMSGWVLFTFWQGSRRVNTRKSKRRRWWKYAWSHLTSKSCCFLYKKFRNSMLLVFFLKSTKSFSLLLDAVMGEATRGKRESDNKNTAVESDDDEKTVRVRQTHSYFLFSCANE